MHKSSLFVLILLLSVFGTVYADNNASSLCAPNETVLYSCIFDSKKMASLCSTKTNPKDSGYLQFRYGKTNALELALPKTRSGMPSLEISRYKDNYMEYNKVAITNAPYLYKIESNRQLKKIRDGYATPKSSDKLSVDDLRKTVWEGNNLFSTDCVLVVTKLDTKTLSKISGIKIQ